MSRRNDPHSVCKADLRREYILNDAWMNRLGAPDTTEPNRYSRNGAPHKLYLRERVEAFLYDHEEEYQSYLRRRYECLVATEDQRRQRREALEAWAATAPIVVSDLPETWDALEDAVWRERAFFLLERHRHDELEELQEVTLGLTLAYLRHNATNYEQLLKRLRRHRWEDQQAAYERLKQRVNAVLVEALRERYGAALPFVVPLL